MSKWVQFYHKINKFDLVSMRFTDDFSIVEMVGMDSVMPIDGRLSLSSIRDVVQKEIESMKKIESFAPCAFSILTGSSILNASESPVYNLWARTGQYDNVLPTINQNRINYEHI